MSVYVIADITVTDDNWVPDYAAHVHNIVSKHGGIYLSRSGNIEVLEGKNSYEFMEPFISTKSNPFLTT